MSRLIKWKPACGERYYYISQCGTISSTKANYGRDTIFKIATGNCFKTYKQCRKALKNLLDRFGLPYFPWGTIEYIGIHHQYLTPQKYIPRISNNMFHVKQDKS